MKQLRILSGGRELWEHTVVPPDAQWTEPPFSGEPFVALIVNQWEGLSREIQNALAERIVAAGCRYAVCTGYESSSWDDAVDWAYLATCKDHQPEDEGFVMTSWHDDEPPEDVVFFFLNLTNFDDHSFRRYLLLFVGTDPTQESRFVSACLGE